MDAPTYPKIQSIFKRDPDTNYKTFLREYTTREFEYLKDNDWVWTEKVDGMNIRVHWTGRFIEFAGRSDRAQIPKRLLAKLEEMFTPGLLNRSYDGRPMTFYGEGYGAGIQGGGKYNPDGVDFILFDIKIADWWLLREDMVAIADTLDIESVPIVGHGSLRYATMCMYSGVLSRVAKSSIPMEGLVLRPDVPLYDRRGERIITKVKYKDYALWREKDGRPGI